MSKLSACVFVALAACAWAASLPRDLPLMRKPLQGTGIDIHHGVTYDFNYPLKNVTDPLYWQIIQAGGKLVQIGMDWASIEADNAAGLNNFVVELYKSGLEPYLNIQTINTNRLALPADLLDPSNPNQLRPGLGWTSPALLARFYALLDKVVPTYVLNGGFFLGVGNEVGAWLGSNAQQIDSFAGFVISAKKYVQQMSPMAQYLAVGVSLEAPTLVAKAPCVQPMFAAADLVSVTFYPLDQNMMALDPSLIPGMVDAIINAYPPQQNVMFQEYGMPSGYLPTPTDNSTEAKQAAFYQAMFASFKKWDARVRVAAAFKMQEWTPEQCAAFAQYYHVDNKQFIEYLCTLGLLHSDGSPKLAYNAYLAALSNSTASLGAVATARPAAMPTLL